MNLVFLRVILTCVFMSCILFLMQNSSLNLRPSDQKTKDLSPSNFRPSRLPPRLIYVDLGTFDGQSLISFIEEASKRTKIASKITNKYGKGNNIALDGIQLGSNFFDFVPLPHSKWEIFAFEANRKHSESMNIVANKLKNDRNDILSVDLHIGTAITTFDGEVEFLLDNLIDGDAGSTLNKESKSSIGKAVKVRAIDVITLLKTIVKATPRDQIFLKIDIEGSEYDVVERLISKGSLYLVDKMAIEWHHNAYMVFGKPGPDDLNFKERMDIHLKFKKRYDSIINRLNGSPFKSILSDWA